VRRERREGRLPPRRQRETPGSYALAQARHAARRLLRAGDQDGARRELARCAQLLHQATPRWRRYWIWPGEYAAMRGPD
jgi:tryptophan 2,3-dioxygenase